MTSPLSTRRILLVVGGGIAAYKSLDLIRRLRERGASVRCILTGGAQQFVTPLAAAGISGQRAHTDLFDREDEADIGHIRLARDADAVVVAPATANLMAKMAGGHADDLASTVLLATTLPILIAPAMNVRMWLHTATQRNLEILRRDGVRVVGPNEGAMAEAETGPGRMSEPLEIVAALEALLAPPGPLAGKRVLVTSGPTYEPLDPVRYISNRSSGKMGYAIAEAARRRGARVTLVSGPTSLIAPAGVDVTRVGSAEEMHAAVLAAAPGHQILIKAAAVADFAAANISATKIKKRDGVDELTIALRRTPDILADVARLSPRPFIVAFAAETDSVEENAREKLQRKGADLIVANDVADALIGFDSDQNEVLVIARDGTTTRLARAPKPAIANRVLDLVIERL